MTESTTFSSRSNAKRAAEKAIRDGTASSIDYRIQSDFPDGYPAGTERFVIAWKTGPTPAEADEQDSDVARQAIAEIESGNDRPITGEELQEHFDSWESEAAEMDPFARIEEPDTDNHVDKEGLADDHKEESETEVSMPDLFPPGTRVIVQVSARKRRTGAVEYRVDATSCRVKFDGPNPSVLCRYNQLALDDGSEQAQVPKKTERRKAEHQRADRKPSKSAELDAAAARGEMPSKPIITSKANQAQYQKRFDKLESLALADDWDAVQSYEVKGINSYAKMVKQYRDRLLVAHEAQQSTSEAA